jgi:hypothetical protein
MKVMKLVRFDFWRETMRRFFLLPLLLLLTACSIPTRVTPTPAGNLIATMVAATLQAMTPVAPPTLLETSTPFATDTPAPTLTPSTGRVSGSVCYLDKGLVEMVLYFEDSKTGQLFKKSVSQPREVYSIELPPGSYKIYGWPPDYTVGVMVKGMQTVDVAPGSFQPGIDFCDYSKGPYGVPYPPGYSPSKERGSISGSISGYGGGDQLTVVAFNLTSGYWYYVILMPGVTTFSITDLPAGRYQVVAYDRLGVTGGTQPDIYVVGSKETKTEINQWGGGFPANPVK